MIFSQALSGLDEEIEFRAKIMKNTALSAALNTQFLFQIGVFTAVPMILGFILEQGFLRVNVCLYPFLVPSVYVDQEIMNYCFIHLYFHLTLFFLCKNVTCVG